MENKLALKIFVVDDDVFSLNIYQQHLINGGYENVRVFENGAACLEAITEDPDVIFLDHNMDIFNGVEVLRKIKRFSPDIHVVFISAQEDITTAVNSLKYGAFDYIVKGDEDLRRIDAVLQKLMDVQAMLRKRSGNKIKKFIPFL